VDACFSEFMFVWAVGMGPLYLPAQAGLPMGSASGEIKYVIMQMHYTNPNFETGHLDSSGFEIYYTQQLRANDAGMLVLGDPLLAQIPIPPKNPNYHIEMTCPEECTSTWPYEIHVYADFLHMHFIGQKIWTNIWRDNQFYTELNDVEYYSYNFQQATDVDVIIKPGDRMNTHCIFDSSSRSAPTVFDIASTDEMCMDFLFYWPKINDLSFCGYYYDNETVCGMNFIDIPNPKVTDPTDLQRTGESFGKPCVVAPSSGDGDDGSTENNNNDDEPWYQSTAFIAVVAVVGGLIVIGTVAAAIALYVFKVRRGEYESI